SLFRSPRARGSGSRWRAPRWQCSWRRSLPRARGASPLPFVGATTRESATSPFRPARASGAELGGGGLCDGLRERPDRRLLLALDHHPKLGLGAAPADDHAAALSELRLGSSDGLGGQRHLLERAALAELRVH